MGRAVGSGCSAGHSKGNPKRQDTKPFPRAIRNELTKVALHQVQQESPTEERVKAEGESETLGVPAFLS